MTSLAELRLEDFLTQLASAAATPGGGGAAALSGAQGAALLAMACRLTLNKPGQADPELEALLFQADRLRARLLALIDRDAEAFQQLMAAYRLPKTAEAERRQAIQSALLQATETPMTCARYCFDVLEHCQAAVQLSHPQVISDVGVAALSAHAGLNSAALNVWINLGHLNNPVQGECWRDQLDALLKRGESLQAATCRMVREKLAA